MKETKEAISEIVNDEKLTKEERAGALFELFKDIDEYQPTAVNLIALERHEQLNRHGYSIEYDAEQNHDGQLLEAAMYCLTGSQAQWPDNFQQCYMLHIFKKDRIEQLVIAAAFIAAEIDRLNYNKNPEKE